MDQEQSRLDVELELLEAMYPTQTSYNPRSREFRFSDHTASLLLRLPDKYPESALPDVISATDSLKIDVRDKIKSAVKERGLADNEEALDAFIAVFQQVVEEHNNQPSSQSTIINADEKDTASQQSKTVIIWLHHLLNTNKRKLALSPPSTSSATIEPSTTVSGLTKPGYPGILVFSGPSPAVAEHVSTLKAQNWQAFQVRYEEDELWDFTHGVGVKEVETMAEVVKGIEVEEDRLGAVNRKGSKQKKEFLEAVGIK